MADLRFAALTSALVVASVLFLAWDLPERWQFVLELRATRLAALIVVGVSTALATVLFQVIASNRILTPALMGFESLFVLLQTSLVWGLGIQGFAALPVVPKYFAEVLAMILVATLLFGSILGRGRQDLHRMILTGVILGILFRSLAGFLQRMLDPNAFSVVQGATFASFSHVDQTLLGLSALVVAGGALVAWRLAPLLDVMALGRTRAVNLGLNYETLTIFLLALVALLASVPVALVGPLSSGGVGPPSFLGLIVVTFAHALVGGARHGRLMVSAALIGALVLVVGQAAFERLFGLESALGVVIDFGGGMLFLGLLLKGRVR